MTDTFAGMGRPRLLIPDTSPLSLLAMVGREGLDWLFTPGAEVWVTDMVREEALREPDDLDDPRNRHRAAIGAWFAANAHRLRVAPTAEGEEYRKAMEAWSRLPDRPPALKPSWKGRGERSVLRVLEGVEALVGAGEAVVVLVDDRRARAAIRALDHVDIDLMATETFIDWVATRFHVVKAETAWRTIRLAAAGKAPDAPGDDPVHLRPARMAGA